MGRSTWDSPNYHGDLLEHGDTLARANEQGYAVGVTLNRTDLEGRKSENIIGIRAIFRDRDRPGVPELPEQPHVVVETSAGKFQGIILVGGIGVDEWVRIQKRLIDDYGSDPNAKAVRVPGFYHQKGERFMVRIVSESGAVPLTREEALKLYPPVEKRERPKPSGERKTDIGRDEVVSALSQIGSTSKGKMAEVENRRWHEKGNAADCRAPQRNGSTAGQGERRGTGAKG